MEINIPTEIIKFVTGDQIELYEIFERSIKIIKLARVEIPNPLIKISGRSKNLPQSLRK